MNISPQDFSKKIYDNEHLPSGLVVKGDLYLDNIPSLTYLPENLTIVGYLGMIKCIYITHLPSGLVVLGWLDITDCSSLTNLPFDLKAGKIFCDKKLIDTIPQEDLPLYINFNFAKNNFAKTKDTYAYYIARLQKKNLQ
jgi:hypothetical protein